MISNPSKFHDEIFHLDKWQHVGDYYWKTLSSQHMYEMITSCVSDVKKDEESSSPQLFRLNSAAFLNTLNGETHDAEDVEDMQMEVDRPRLEEYESQI